MPNDPKSKYMLDNKSESSSLENVGNGVPVSKSYEENSPNKNKINRQYNSAPNNKNTAVNISAVKEKKGNVNLDQSNNSDAKEGLRRDLTATHIANMVKESPSDLKEEIMSTP